MHTFRGTALAAVAAASLVGLSACAPGSGSASGGGKAAHPSAVRSSASAVTGGGGSPELSAVDALALVKKRTSSVHSAKFELTVKTGGTPSLTESGALDWSHGVRMTMTAEVTDASALRSMRSAGLDGTIRYRLLPDVYYLDLGPGAAAHLGGKHWIRYGVDELATSSAGAYVTDVLQSQDLSRAVDLVLASRDVREVGTESVRGVPATHYRGTIALADLTRLRAPHLSAAQRADVERSMRKAGVTEEKLDVWVSADHLPLKKVATEGENVTTMYWWGYGTPVRVQAPPASDSVDAAGL
ncbi:hypothetical protein [Actinacidiphila acididurans]|uniref:Lipoprotein n=1 Tax=Actinacidiphila acididurans TaxID=2784346 RepID=A0ABS2TS64_9ACTN|nr:hypothetical protein [Actinacidiphila acididurans]MBM9506174.1 hypothetical protein [Actinacidiphila acididurans]